MSFETLLGDLQALHDQREQVMAKSLASDGAKDDDKISGAAAEAGATLPEGGAAAEGGSEGGAEAGAAAAATAAAAAAAEGGDGDESDELPMGKSFMYDDEGNRIEVVDATEMVKSLTLRLEQSESGAEKAIGMAVDLIKSQAADLLNQGAMIKSLGDQVAALSNQGRGRVAVVSMAEKPGATPMAKAQEPAGLPPQEFMAKALQAQIAGRLSGRDVSVAEGYLQKGLAVPADIVNRVFAS
jgi:hypothetical protein